MLKVPIAMFDRFVSSPIFDQPLDQCELDVLVTCQFRSSLLKRHNCGVTIASFVLHHGVCGLPFQWLVSQQCRHQHQARKKN